MWTDEPVKTASDFEILGSGSFLDDSSKNEDVEKLLRSSSPTRQQSLNPRGRPPSGRAFLKSFSRSPSPSIVKQLNSNMSVIRGSNKWQEDWRNALDKAVDDPEMPQKIAASDNTVGVLDSSRSNDWSPIKASHDLTFSYDDSGNYKSRRPFLLEESVPTRLSRSQSMSRLNKSMYNDNCSHVGSLDNNVKITGKSMQDLHNNLEESENRRNVLIHKLKEAQTTLELQNERLNKIEASAKENSLLVEDLKMKEMAYRKKILHLEGGQEEKQRLKMENLRLREEMQARISKLDMQLKQLKSQHNSNESENDKRTHLLNHTTTILSLLEEENAKLHQDKEKLLSEFTLTKEAFTLTKSNYGNLEMDHHNLKNECIRLKEDNTALARKVQEMAGQMLELRSLLQAVRDENERISSTWRTNSQDKVQVVKQIENYKDMISDLKSRLATTSSDRDRLFQEKLEMNSKIQQMVLDKEQLMRAKLNLEDQMSNYHPSHTFLKSSNYQQDIEKTELTKELVAVKKVSEELTAELSSVKLYYEQALEQVAALEKTRSILQSQQSIEDQEKARLSLEIERLMRILKERESDEKNSIAFQDEQIYQLRNELKKIRSEKNELEAKVQELNTKVAKPNNGSHGEPLFQNAELDMWKNTCERLTSSLAHKESELQNIMDRCHQLEDTISGLRKDIRVQKERNESFSTQSEDIERLKSENKHLLLVKNENEQMIKLLDTQKSVLTKASEDAPSKARELDYLKEQVSQLGNENEMLRRKNAEFEKQLEKANKMQKSPIVDNAGKKIEELQTANKDLKKKNEELMLKLELVNQENARSRRESSDSSTKTEIQSLRDENAKLMREVESLRQENIKARTENSNTNTGTKESSEVTQLRKEKDAMQKQVTLLQGQMNLIEGSKKRAEDQVSRLNTELSEMRVKMSQVNSSQNSLLEIELKKELEVLKGKLEEAKKDSLQQETIINKLNEGICSEQQEMKKKIKELESELELKKKLVDSLESKLKLAETQAETRGQELQHLYKTIKETEQSNMKSQLDKLANHNNLTNETKLHQEQSSRKPETRMSIQEELSSVLKSKKDEIERLKASPFRSKSLNSADLKNSSTNSPEAVPEKTATDGSTRLQSLISKYRSHSDTEDGTQHLANKPTPPKVAIKTRSGLSLFKPSNEHVPASEKPPASQEILSIDSQTSSNTVTAKPAKKLPPEPLPKPVSPLSTWTKSTFMRSVSGDNAVKDSVPKLSSPATLLSTFPAASTPSAQKSPSSSGLGLSLGDSEEFNDSQEQRDINALIQKEITDRFNEMASF